MITRFLQKEIEQELENDKILIVLGPRQSGKTTLLKRISEKLEERGEQVHFYNFDRTNDLDFFKSQQKVEAFLKIRSIKQRMYIFIDEVQRMKNAGTFFKYFYDAGVNAKFIFSGSSSVEIKDEFGDALTGRKRVFTLLPLSLAEVAANTLGDEWIYAQAGDPQALEKFSQLVETSLLWGNYPEVSTNALEEQKLKAIGELYESYVQKDIKDLMRVKN
ncbi:MAG: ATP-binding protein, partial [Candidatus Dojkabacteria bacterium]